jgi:deoxyribodipyrimidine photo-lyase
LDKTAVNIVWFKRDLRFFDNEALFHAHQSGLPLLLVYIFEPSVMNYDDADVRHWRFIYESIQYLQRKLNASNSKLYFFHN